MSDIVSRVHIDRSEKKIHFERIQDVEPILEWNKAVRDMPQPRAGTFRHVGTIPCVVLEKWIHDDGAKILAMRQREFAKYVKRKLNDPDWAYLKTIPGTV